MEWLDDGFGVGVDVAGSERYYERAVRHVSVNEFSAWDLFGFTAEFMVLGFQIAHDARIAIGGGQANLSFSIIRTSIAS